MQPHVKNPANKKSETYQIFFGYDPERLSEEPAIHTHRHDNDNQLTPAKDRVPPFQSSLPESLGRVSLEGKISVLVGGGDGAAVGREIHRLNNLEICH